jgi:hypothetical protein
MALALGRVVLYMCAMCVCVSCTVVLCGYSGGTLWCDFCVQKVTCIDMYECDSATYRMYIHYCVVL